MEGYMDVFFVNIYGFDISIVLLGIVLIEE